MNRECLISVLCSALADKVLPDPALDETMPADYETWLRRCHHPVSQLRGELAVALARLVMDFLRDATMPDEIDRSLPPDAQPRWRPKPGDN